MAGGFKEAELRCLRKGIFSNQPAPSVVGNKVSDVALSSAPSWTPHWQSRHNSEARSTQEGTQRAQQTCSHWSSGRQAWAAAQSEGLREDLQGAGFSVCSLRLTHPQTCF